MWRFRELLPIDGETILGFEVGGTPLIRAERLARVLGVDELYIKNDAVNFPTLSLKDRVISVALTKAREFGMTTVGCASTGNLANSVAAQAVRNGFRTCILRLSRGVSKSVSDPKSPSPSRGPSTQVVASNASTSWSSQQKS
ncbi:MAG: pyridoxal-phosphate dependent enzyme [Acidobacteria bacterium]|nr:pyridoxal-phosphate dependent enzyme [Acidobacteriota bacterium]